MNTYFSETESENEFRPLDERIDEFHPKATRTLFIGNLEKTTTYHDLLNIFQRFGEIVVGYCFQMKQVIYSGYCAAQIEMTILTYLIYLFSLSQRILTLKR